MWPRKASDGIAEADYCRRRGFMAPEIPSIERYNHLRRVLLDVEAKIGAHQLMDKWQATGIWTVGRPQLGPSTFWRGKKYLFGGKQISFCKAWCW
jgi:hypothetical protein